jgi:mono/diheme cytochrome c family protein
MKPKSLIKFALLLCAMSLAAGLTGNESRAAQEVEEGQKITAEKCSSCHSFEVTGQQDASDLARSGGPPLSFAGNKFQQPWLEKWLVNPQRIRPAGYLPFRYVVSTPTGDRIDESLLPVHPSLSQTEAKVVARYLASLKREVNPHPSGDPSTSIRAQLHFEKVIGCSSCHQARPGGGGLSGPELITVSERLDREWATAFMTDPLYWSSSPMPKVSIRGDQLMAISDYLFQDKTGQGGATSSSPPPKASQSPSTSKPLPKGRAELIYQVYCTQCHGLLGNGKGINAPYMFVSPRNHTSFDEMSMLTDDRLFAVIKFGGPAVGKSVLMPSWGAVIKDSDINLLVDYLRALSGTRTTTD